MEKTDIVLFGKYKGLTWDAVLTKLEGTVWGDWWSETQSKGPYANRENKMKNIWRSWRGLNQIDTKKLVVGLDEKALFEKLDSIERKIDDLINDKEKEDDWTNEA